MAILHPIRDAIASMMKQIDRLWGRNPIKRADIQKYILINVTAIFHWTQIVSTLETKGVLFWLLKVFFFMLLCHKPLKNIQQYQASLGNIYYHMSLHDIFHRTTTMGNDFTFSIILFAWEFHSKCNNCSILMMIRTSLIFWMISY